MPDKLKIEHHTLADWDFEHGATYRTLFADKYVSPPHFTQVLWRHRCMAHRRSLSHTGNTGFASR